MSNNQKNESINEMSSLINRVDKLENTVNHITEQQGTLTHRLRQYADSMDDVIESVDELRSQFNNIEEEAKFRDSKIESINDSLDYLEDNLQDTRSDIKDTSDEIDRRLRAIENTLGLDDLDIAQAVKPNACELEQLTTIPEESRAESFDIRVQRAIALYEQFTDISEPIKSGGRRLLSKDVKTFLNGYSKADMAYSQVHRVIDSFDEKTNDDYTSVQTEDGRAIIYDP